MSVLDREALEASPLADLHTIASELGIDGYRRLRKADLVDKILGATGGGTSAGTDETDEAEAPSRPRRRRGGRGRGARDADEREAPAAAASDDDEEDEPENDGDKDEAPARPARRRSPRAEEPAADEDEDGGDERPRGRRRGRRDAEPEAEPAVVEGILDLLPNGSGFVRVAHPETSDDDVYVSAAQVRRCELVAGDKVSGPARPARRSEKHPSLVRVDTINGASADEVAGKGTRFDDLPAAYPEARLALGSEDPTLKAIEWLTPFGKGSRVAITGPARAGKTEALRRIAAALAGREGLEVWTVLAGARPEEVGEWEQGPAEVAGAAPLGAGADAQAAVVEAAVERARRIAARGGDAVVVIDSLDALPPHTARRALAAARNLRDAGSVTIVAAAVSPLGGESTVVALDAALTAAGRFPAIDLGASGTIRPDLLVGDAGAEAIASARAEVL